MFNKLLKLFKVAYRVLKNKFNNIQYIIMTIIKFKDYPEFQPNLTPREIFKLGSFGGTYWLSLIHI